jgi:hypothetical protein
MKRILLSSLLVAFLLAAGEKGSSETGAAGWVKYEKNPIVRPGKGQWDEDAVYKPIAIFDGKRWLLWYNGRKGGVEQIGVAIHDGEDLGF